MIDFSMGRDKKKETDTIDVSNAPKMADLPAEKPKDAIEEARESFSRWVKKVAGLKKAVEDFKVTDEQTMNEVLDLSLKAQEIHKRVEKKRKELVRPYLDTKKGIDDIAKSVTRPLSSIVKMAKDKARPIMIEVQRKKDEEARKRLEEEEAILKTMGDDEDDIDLVPTKPAAGAGKREYETGTAELKSEWKYELEDLAKVPRKFLTVQVNHDTIMAAIENGERNIPGLRIFEDHKIETRTKRSK